MDLQTKGECTEKFELAPVGSACPVRNTIAHRREGNLRKKTESKQIIRTVADPNNLRIILLLLRGNTEQFFAECFANDPRMYDLKRAIFMCILNTFGVANI